jgi:protein-disulfide isomerase
MTGSTNAPANRRAATTAVILLAAALMAVLAIRLGEDVGGAPAGDIEEPTLGDADAPVELVEYSDFACPFCGRYARDTKPSVIADYVDTGVVRYVWRDLPLQGEGSTRAAVAARAAQAQGRFWEFHSAVFAHERPDLSPAGLRQTAAEAGLDLDAYDEALDDPAHAAAVQAGADQGVALGLSGTPSFTVDGEVIVGAQPYEVFANVIEEAAARHGD